MPGLANKTPEQPRGQGTRPYQSVVIFECVRVSFMVT